MAPAGVTGVIPMWSAPGSEASRTALQFVSKASLFGVLSNPNHADAAAQVSEMQRA